MADKRPRPPDTRGAKSPRYLSDDEDAGVEVGEGASSAGLRTHPRARRSEFNTNKCAGSIRCLASTDIGEISCDSSP